MIADDWKEGGFALYVHWPFCEAKCPYCDFNSHVVDLVNHPRWARALVSELKRISVRTKGRVLKSVYFGGGTPSLMAPETVQAVLDASKEDWLWANDIEITLEANPRSVEAGQFRAFRDAGINRISMGIQALNNRDLKRLGRLHTVEEALTAFDTARRVFDRVSFDLIYARQDQTMADWRRELTEALEMAADHLSLYQLTIEPGTAFWSRAKKGGLLGLPEEDLAADLYHVTQELCDKAGFPAYEVSNHARNKSISRHNMVYWTYGDYAGIGPGAHGRLTLDGVKTATEAISMPAAWLKAAENGDGSPSQAVLTNQDMLTEYIMLGMRTNDGVDIERARRMVPGVLPDELLSHLCELDLVELRSSRLMATRNGRLVLNSLVSELIPD